MRCFKHTCNDDTGRTQKAAKTSVGHSIFTYKFPASLLKCHDLVTTRYTPMRPENWLILSSDAHVSRWVWDHSC